jgi:uncharacterized protein
VRRKNIPYQGVFEDHCPLFELTGEKEASLPEQLQNFVFAYHAAFPNEPISRIRSWREAFHLLASTIDRIYSTRRIVIFLDELPWLASPQSKFLTALDHLWNAWGNRRNILLIVCGSAASWMVGKLIHDKDGLNQ